MEQYTHLREGLVTYLWDKRQNFDRYRLVVHLTADRKTHMFSHVCSSRQPFCRFNTQLTRGGGRRNGVCCDATMHSAEYNYLSSNNKYWDSLILVTGFLVKILSNPFRICLKINKSQPYILYKTFSIFLKFFNSLISQTIHRNKD